MVHGGHFGHGHHCGCSTGGIFSGVLSSDSGFWDAYRTVYPLNSLVRADVMSIQVIFGPG